MPHREQERLPRLELPPLDATLQRLTAALNPLMTDHQREELAKKVQDFKGSAVSKSLQSQLQRLHDNEECYLDHLHLDHILIDHKALPRNPFLVLEDDPLRYYILPQDQPARAGLLTTSALKFVSALRNGGLSEDSTRRGEKLTMAPYWNLFGSTRVPEMDGVKTKVNKESDYILILSKSQFYTLKVLDEENNVIHTPDELAAILRQIIDESNQVVNPNRSAIGSITSDTYKNWNHARSVLQRDFKEKIALVDAALFVLVLDHSEPEDTDEELAKAISVGSMKIDERGVQTGSCISRWYDKLQLVVTKTAVAGVIWDSFSQDGTTVLRFTSDIYADSVLRLTDGNHSLFPTVNSPKPGPKKPEPVKIEWGFGSDMMTFIHLSETRLTDLICSHSTNTAILGYGRRFARKIGVKADSLIQVALQIAQYALYGKPISTVEPVSTRLFQNARSELLPLQDDTITKACQIFVSSDSSQNRWRAFLDACNFHSSALEGAAKGQGFEKHLKALQNVYIQREVFNQVAPEFSIPDGEPPLIFDDVIYPLFVPEMIASNCGNPAMRLFGLTPAVQNGFGIGYIIKDDSTEFCLISQYRQGDRFLSTLDWVLHQVSTIWKKEVGVKRAPHAYEFDNKKRDEVRRRGLSVSHTIQTVHMSRSATVGSSEDDVDLALGGYGYFDIDDLTLRSVAQSDAATPALSKTNSEADLSKLSTELDKTFGKKLHLSEKLREGFEKHGSDGSSGGSELDGSVGALERFDAKFDRGEVGKKVDIFDDDDDE
jgi:carnitine O-acetyltransferase